MKCCSKECLKECVMIVWLAFMITTFLFQSVGFFTQHWACGKEYNSTYINSTCIPEGLYIVYSCNNDSSICENTNEVLDGTVFTLCFLCFLSNLYTVPALLYVHLKQFKKSSKVEFITDSFTCHCKHYINGSCLAHAFCVYNFSQYLASIALFRLLAIRDSWIDWSAAIFLYPALIMALPIYCSLVLMVAHCIYMCVCDDDDD